MHPVQHTRSPTPGLSSGSCRRSGGGLVRAKVPQRAHVRAHLVLVAPHLLLLTSPHLPSVQLCWPSAPNPLPPAPPPRRAAGYGDLMIKDVCDFAAAVDDKNFTLAADIYANGANNPEKTLKGGWRSGRPPVQDCRLAAAHLPRQPRPCLTGATCGPHASQLVCRPTAHGFPPLLAGWAQSDHTGAPYFDLYAAYFNDSLWLDNWIEVRPARASLAPQVPLPAAKLLPTSMQLYPPACSLKFIAMAAENTVAADHSSLSAYRHPCRLACPVQVFSPTRVHAPRCACPPRPVPKRC